MEIRYTITKNNGEATETITLCDRVDYGDQVVDKLEKLREIALKTLKKEKT